MDKSKTGKLIEQLRKEQGMTQKQLAEKLHISDRTVSKWERGVGFPDISLVEPLADALNISVVSLIRGEVSSMPEEEASVRSAISIIYRNAKQKFLKNLISIIASVVIAVGFVWFIWAVLDYNGAFLKDVSLSVPVTVYQDGQAVEESTVTIEGKRAKGTFSGTFAIDYVEKTTRDEVQGYVGWGEEGVEYDYLR
ncbi:MAG: helix-turn-helix domain-containing protein, partial [Firmicutes bacterium]|nr:helix-turn-helix domain-containing protein [Bacillota bacterium]